MKKPMLKLKDMFKNSLFLTVILLIGFSCNQKQSTNYETGNNNHTKQNAHLYAR